VLWRGWKYVRQLKASAQYVCFPFAESVIQEWIDEAIQDCRLSPDFLKKFGGTDFDLEDSGTYWTQPSHFFTWWKNNVERKSKFQSLSRDAISKEDATFDRLRTFYCQQAVALSVNIRNHFDRILHQQRDNCLYQVTLPVGMPDHMVLENFASEFHPTDIAVTAIPLTVVFSSLDKFIVSKFPSLKKYLKCRAQRDGSFDTALSVTRSHNALASDNLGVGHIRCKYVLNEDDMPSPANKSRSVSLSSDVDEELSHIVQQHGMSLRPRPAKRPRTYAVSLPNAAFDDDDNSDRARLLHSDSFADEEDFTEEDGNEFEEDERDEDYCGETEHVTGQSCHTSNSTSVSPRKRGRPSSYPFATSSHSRRRIVALKVIEVLTRYEQEELTGPMIETSQSASTTTPTDALPVSPTGRLTAAKVNRKSPKPRRVKLPKSPSRPYVHSTETVQVSNEYIHESADSHTKTQGILARPMDLDDFQLFDEQEMLADSMLIKDVSQLAIVQEAHAIEPKSVSDMLTLYPLPKSYQSPIDGKNAVLSYDSKNLLTDETYESVVCGACETPRNRSQLCTPWDASRASTMTTMREAVSPDSICGGFSSPSIWRQKKAANTSSFVPIQDEDF
jgi:hypothetical protein